MTDLHQRPDLLRAGEGKLNFLERLNLRWVRASFEPGWFNSVLRLCQRTVGQGWIHYGSRHLRHVFGKDRLPSLEQDGSILVVANHRSFFDLYVITAELVRAKMKKRIVFPVRSTFFYDHPLGFLVNLLASFLAMYPPLFRERKKAALNLLGLDELGWMLRRGGVFAGIHPEGTRNRGDDPYQLLPAQPGVGRIIYKAQVPVVPVFVLGLGNDFFGQLKRNFLRKGEPITVVFGSPVALDDLLSQNPSPRLYQKIAQRCMDAIAEVGQEERKLRAELLATRNARVD
jgi:1-acyl-sn-glycerol-3-phosphate acyltransferase